MIHRWYDLHSGICGLSSAVGLSEAATHLLKLYMQQRRPNFYALCQFDMEKRACTASMAQIAEANLTFPSGHSSLACCGMTFLVWYLLGKLLKSSPIAPSAFSLNSNNNSGQSKNGHKNMKQRILGLLICLLPWSWALFVAASRVADYWHHPADVVVGLLLGGSICTIVYHFWYPPLWAPPSMVGIPWSFHNGPGGMLEAKLPSFHE